MKNLEEARQLFKEVINSIYQDLGENLLFPTRIYWIGGAPGAGKGINTDYISKVLKIEAKSIVTSDLLQSPEAKAIKNAGGLVRDKEVIYLLFRELLKSEYSGGVIVDGFPRTMGQVEALKELEKVMTRLSAKGVGVSPRLVIILLYVSESESIRRQLMRGKQIAQRNEEAKIKGLMLEELRSTDVDPKAAAKRYQVFKETTFETLDGLKGIFEFHGIDASGTLEEVRANIDASFL